MRGAILSVLAGSALAMASAASAATSCGTGCSFTVAPGVDPYAGPAPTYTFDPGSQPGGTTTGNYKTGSLSGIYAQPYGTAAGTGAYGGLGYYYEVGPGTSQPGTIDLTSFANISSLSFIWGSVDTYNTLEVLNKTGGLLYTILGSDIINPADGNQTDPTKNPLVIFNFAPSATATGGVGYLKFSSTSNAFEMDNLAINPVPEPATWMLMLLGFGGIGMAMRRRRRPALAQIA